MRKILVTGGNGMLAAALKRKWTADTEIFLCGRSDADVTCPGSFADAVAKYSPDAVVNCAAMTHVDECESRREQAMLVNAFAVRDMGKYCRAHGIPFMTFSSDYVFDGQKGPYREKSAVGRAVNVYGESKALGERLLLEANPDALIVRTSWLYGGSGPSFVHTMIRLARESEDMVRVVNDQLGAPTWTDALAVAIQSLFLQHRASGIVHCVCENWTSWYGLAREVFMLCGCDPERVIPVASVDFPRPARRPHDSRLLNDRLKTFNGCSMPDWRSALQDFFSAFLQKNGEGRSL